MNRILVFILILSALYACKKEEVSTLNPNAGPDQMVVPFDLVELDGTATTGSEDFTIIWTYDGDIPEQEINFLGTNTLNPTFIPPQPGLYYFTLTITDGISSASDVVKIEATGGVEIGGKLSENLILKNLESDPELPDYTITSDLIIPSGLKCTIEEDGVVILVGGNTGIVVETGGLFSNYHSEYQRGYETVFKSSTGWKGILVQGGSLTLQNARIEKAGQSAFDVHPEKGAVILTEGSVLEKDFSNNSFIGSLATDFIMEPGVSADSAFTDNNLSHAVPMKVPFNYLSKIMGDNTFPASYDYIHLLPKFDELEILPERQDFKMYGQKYFMDGTLHLGGVYLFIESGSELYFKEGSGIVVIDGRIDVQDWAGGRGPVIMDGLNSSPWKGIALAGKGKVNLRSVQLSNAGNGVFNTSLFKSEQPAAIYHASTTLTIEKSHITNSGGYGVYYAGATGTLIYNIFDNIFENTQLAALRSTIRSVDRMVKADHGNTFIMNNGVPAVLVEADEEFYELTGTWQAIGDGNYYIVDTDLKRTRDLFFTIMPGAILKFTKDKQLIFEYNFADLGMFRAIGTADQPIIFESADPNEKWGGIRISGMFEMKYCQIRDAGSTLLPDAPHLTNIFIDIDRQASLIPFLNFSNCTVTGSDGYGAIVNNYVLPGWDPGNPENNNVFNDNALGDIFYITE